MRLLPIVLLLVPAACSDDAAGGESGAGAGENGAAATAPTGPAPGSPGFAAYTEQLADGAVTFDMVPVAGGTFTMGSAPGAPDHGDDEAPPHAVTVEPFWIGRCEVTWGEYDIWYEADLPQAKVPDGTSKPTPPYVDMTFNMGRDGFPAICMSHTAARQYCAWLSRTTGRFYRLPTEAEWEYACRAGTTTTWSCGDDAAALDAVAWYAGNSEERYHRVGNKEPNAWGLHDMHGNVAEWVADHYLADAYAQDVAAAAAGGPVVMPFHAPPPDKRGRPIRFPHVARGGSWQDPPAALRSAARRSSDRMWNKRDPQLPKSWWYLTEGQHVGFRVVRPLREPTEAERARFEAL